MVNNRQQAKEQKSILKNMQCIHKQMCLKYSNLINKGKNHFAIHKGQYMKYTYLQRKPNHKSKQCILSELMSKEHIIICSHPNTHLANIYMFDQQNFHLGKMLSTNLKQCQGNQRQSIQCSFLKNQFKCNYYAYRLLHFWSKFLLKHNSCHIKYK